VKIDSDKQHVELPSNHEIGGCARESGCEREYIFRGIGRGLALSKCGRIDNIFTRVQNAGERGAARKISPLAAPCSSGNLYLCRLPREIVVIFARRVRLIEFAARKMLVVRSPGVRIASEQRSGNWFVTF
jgi:hypothetical protein